MQAVADALGVSRKAVHYYVKDKQNLLVLSVLDRFESELGSIDVPTGGNWTAALRAYAHAARNSLIQIGAAVEHLPFTGSSAGAALGLAERLLSILIDAGFSADSSRRTLIALSNLALSSARTVVSQLPAEHNYGAEIRMALRSSSSADYPTVSEVHQLEPERDNDAQFAFELDTIIAGLETIRRTPSQPSTTTDNQHGSEKI